MTRTHEIKLDGYGAHTTLAEDRPVMLLGTAESYGIETLHVVSGKSWEGLTVTATFNAPDGTSTDVLMGTDGNIAVPTEATAKSGSGRIVFTGVSEGVQRISCDLDYFVVAHSAINGAQSGGTAPSWFEQAVNRFMPLGGTTGQVLTKKTDADFDAEWQDSKGGTGGITPTIGDNGNWYLGATDTGKPSRGEKGDTGANGPQGPKGDTGATGATGADGKSAYSYAVDGGYTGTEAEFAAKLAAEKLPNPYPLTFTGAVNETYDGSSAKTIEIPSGGGGETIIAEETVLASGTIATETAAQAFTASGITFGMLRNYKHWTVEFKSASQSTYLAAGYKNGSGNHFICRLQAINIKFQCEWLDKQKTIIRVFAVGGSGYGYGVSDISQSTGNSAQASMTKQDQYIIADVADDTVLGFFNHAALTNDILWRVKGVFKYGN